jgi:hypothetical protein
MKPFAWFTFQKICFVFACSLSLPPLFLSSISPSLSPQVVGLQEVLRLKDLQCFETFRKKWSLNKSQSSFLQHCSFVSSSNLNEKLKLCLKPSFILNQFHLNVFHSKLWTVLRVELLGRFNERNCYSVDVIRHSFPSRICCRICFVDTIRTLKSRSLDLSLL